VFNHGGATAALRRPDHPNVVNVPAPARTYLRGALEAVRAVDPQLATLAVAHTTTGFAAEVAEGLTDAARAAGVTPTAVSCPAGGMPALAGQVPTADMLAVAGRFDDEVAALRRLRRRAWKAAAFVGAGVDEVFAELPRLREGLLGPAQWTLETAATPDEGPEASWFAAAFTARTGRPPSYPAAQAFAAGLIAARCLRDADTTDDEAVGRAARRLSCTTLYGPFALDPDSGLQTAHQVVIVQWQDGRRRVVWPTDRATTALRHPLAAPE
jgi:branched-chain amino acid transport system substrate-binding protein